MANIHILLLSIQVIDIYICDLFLISDTGELSSATFQALLSRLCFKCSFISTQSQIAELVGFD